MPREWVEQEELVLRVNRLFVVLILAMLVAVASTAAFAKPQENTPRAKKFEVGLIGDFPYGPEKEVEAQNLFDELNGERLAFVTHDGDIKTAPRPAPTTCMRRSTGASKPRLTRSFTPPATTIGRTATVPRTLRPRRLTR